MRNGLTLAAALLLLLPAAPGEAKVVTKPVSYSHAGVKLEGLLAYDDARTAKGKLPGVLVLPEWWGLTPYPKGRAEQLAAMGYVAFAADMYGAGVTVDDPKKAGELAGPFYGKPLMAERATPSRTRTPTVTPGWKDSAAVGYDAAAARRSWKAMQIFLDELFGSR